MLGMTHMRTLELAQQVGPIFARALVGLFLPPFRDLTVISTEQNFRYFPSAKLGGARVLRCLQ